ncbi:MAG: hypothetical protein ACK56K_04695, partial [Akkermansiaceae bacterium]
HAGLEFGVVSSAFAFHFFVCWFGLQSAPTHHNHSLASGPIFGVLLKTQPIATPYRAAFAGILQRAAFAGQIPRAAL